MIILVIFLLVLAWVVYLIVSNVRYKNKRIKELEELGLLKPSDEECPFLCGSKRSFIDKGEDFRYCTHYRTNLKSSHWSEAYKCLACAKKIKI
jgi:hypothetical protein